MMKDILVVGSGGREHAIIIALKKSANCGKLYCASGNAGIAELAKCIAIDVMDFKAIADYTLDNKIDLVVVAPDDPLAGGLVDYLEERGIRAFGPNKRAAIIEASKSFSKELMKKYNIPTAEYELFEDYAKARLYLETAKIPIVIKADGLALGKGVIICETREQAFQAIKEMMVESTFGQSGKAVVIEEFMTGKEVSILAFCDGKTVIPMVSSQDHKRAYDNDEGLNTGGMGTFSPSKAYSEEYKAKAMETIILPTIHAMATEGRAFKGVLYFGLMLTDTCPKVVEYNARFGDPEAQVVLPLLKTDLIDIMEACIDGTLDKKNIEWLDKSAVCVILASGGYPIKYTKGYKITFNHNPDEVTIYHAGTKSLDNGYIVTNGGRVLGITAVANTIEEARILAYKNADKIVFEGKHFRTDIGIKL